MAAQFSSWYATPPVAVGSRFTSIMAVEWRGVLNRSYKSDRQLVFSHVVLTKTLGIRRAREISSRISRRMDLLERGIQSGLVRGAEAEGAVREGKDARGGEE